MISPIELAEKGYLPDTLIRLGIRKLCQQRLLEEHSNNPEKQSYRYQNLLKGLQKSAIALETDKANEQHYEVPSEFFMLALGEHLKYSACYWTPETKQLNEAERLSLRLSAERAELEDGQQILELGCGWGSLTLWMAEQYPNSQITAVSNSASQKAYIDDQAEKRSLKNIQVITEDINNLSLDHQFDRVMSIEMFEHVRNYASLLERISRWLKADGKLWVHIFCHRYLMYPFEDQGEDNWMGRYFFSGGLMPASDTLLHFQEHLVCDKRWQLPGTHYQKTAEAWLANMDQNGSAIMKLFNETYGGDQARLWYNRWRIFFMSCAELFGYNQGNEWLVNHYLFSKRT